MYILSMLLDFGSLL